jgi:hypothetical protein
MIQPEASMPATTASVLQQEWDFFEQQRLDLLAQAPGKYALVKGSELIGIFDTELEAVRAGYQKIGNEPFLVKHIVEADIPLQFTSFTLGI